MEAPELERFEWRGETQVGGAARNQRVYPDFGRQEVISGVSETG